MSLHRNRLSGKIPAKLGSLRKLTYLDLGDNQLSGEIPVELGNLRNLTWFHLDHNQLSGKIPDCLGNIKSPFSLNLSYNQLSSSDILFSLNHSVRIQMEQNRLGFSSIVPNINDGDGNARNSRYKYSPQRFLDTKDSIFVDIDSSIEISVSDDYYSNVYTWYKDGKAIDDSSNNSTYTINSFTYSDIGNYWVEITNPSVPRLTLRRESIRLLLGYNSKNRLNSITDSLALVALHDNTGGFKWDNRWDLNSPYKKWYGVEITESGRVSSLNLTHNNLDGNIPIELGLLDSLDRLYLNNNNLVGTIPVEIGSLRRLEWLLLDNNELSGTIPVELGLLDSLDRLYLNNNRLDGEIPLELGNLSSLKWLLLNNNELSGIIPTELENLHNLQRLHLNNNNLVGTIPIEVANLNSLENLWLHDNKLIGEIPTEIGTLSNLIWLNVRNNEFSSCGDLSLLPIDVYIDMSSNNLEFSSIVPNSVDANGEKRGDNYLYSPQGSLDDNYESFSSAGSEISMSVSDTYPGNIYNWYKDGNIIAVVDSNVYIIESLSVEDSGKYWASVTNPEFSDTFTIWRKTITLDIATMNSVDTKDLVDTINTVDVGLISGLASNGNSILLYPNPVLDRLHIRIDNLNGLDCSLELVDNRGIVLLNKRLDGMISGDFHNLDVSFLDAGMYYAIVRYGNSKEALNLVKE